MKSRVPIEPVTLSDWQVAVDAATALRALADTMAYGLITGGPQVDISRCDEIISRGRAMGIQPSASDTELARRFAAEWNSGQ